MKSTANHPAQYFISVLWSRRGAWHAVAHLEAMRLETKNGEYLAAMMQGRTLCGQSVELATSRHIRHCSIVDHRLENNKLCKRCHAMLVCGEGMRRHPLSAEPQPASA